MNKYNIDNVCFVKIADHVNELRSHSSVPIPSTYPFYHELGTFAVEGCDDEGIFFIKDQHIRLCYDSAAKSGQKVYNIMRKVYFDGIQSKIQKMRKSEGIGPEFMFAGFRVRKVSDEIPYVGHLRFHEFSDKLIESHEWLSEQLGKWDFKLHGTYRILGTESIFFLKNDQVEVIGEEGDTHPIILALTEHFPVRSNMEDMEEDIGPCGGAFASESDYWRYIDSSLFSNMY